MAGGRALKNVVSFGPTALTHVSESQNHKPKEART